MPRKQPAKKSRPAPRIGKILSNSLIAVVLACAAGIVLTRSSWNIARTVSNPQTSVSSASSGTSSQTAPIPARRADIAAAKAKNSDVVGWLTVPGTTLDMPIVQTTNNDFYLTHGLDKKPDSTGYATPFMDYRNHADNLDRNTILYGHHMLFHSLFGQLDQNYRNLAFLNQHPVIYFGTATQDRYWKIFAVYPTDINFYYIQTDFTDDNAFLSLVAQMRKQSLFNTGVDVKAGDKILTLSTCTYDGFKDGEGRFVVEARLVRPGESYSVPAATENPDPASPHHSKTT